MGITLSNRTMESQQSNHHQDHTSRGYSSNQTTTDRQSVLTHRSLANNHMAAEQSHNVAAASRSRGDAGGFPPPPPEDVATFLDALGIPLPAGSSSNTASLYGGANRNLGGSASLPQIGTQQQQQQQQLLTTLSQLQNPRAQELSSELNEQIKRAITILSSPPGGMLISTDMPAASASASVSNPESSSAEDNQLVTHVACRARGMPLDHNYKTAYFTVPKHPKHGFHLVCNYPECRNAGVKFLWCTTCKAPVAKRNFKSRHNHNSQNSLLEDENGGGKLSPEELNDSPTGDSPPSSLRVDQVVEGNQNETDSPKKPSHASATHIVNPREHAWTRLLEERPEDANEEAITSWLIKVLTTSDMEIMPPKAPDGVPESSSSARSATSDGQEGGMEQRINLPPSEDQNFESTTSSSPTQSDQNSNSEQTETSSNDDGQSSNNDTDGEGLTSPRDVD